MASILLLTGLTSSDAATRTAAALTGEGHTVTLSNATTTGALDTAWGGGFDAIGTVRVQRSSSIIGAWLRGKWDAGVPILLGGTEQGANSGETAHYATSLDIASGALTRSNTATGNAAARSMPIDSGNSTHPIVDGISSPVTIYTSSNYWTVFQSSDTWAGDRLGTNETTSAYLTAVEVGDPLVTSGNAPARAVFCGWMYAHQSDYSSTAKTILGRALDWLVATPPAAIALTLTATTGGSVDLGVVAPSFATLTLTATTGGSVDLDGGSTLGVAFIVTTGGSATLGSGSAVYTSTRLTVTTGGSATLGVIASAAAALTVSTSGSAWLGRTWGRDPITGRGACTLTVTDRAGTPLASLDSAYLTRAIVDRLNDVDGTGSGTAFTVPDEATDAHTALRQYREVQVTRGGHHLGTYVLLNPDDTGTASSVSWQAAGLGHYLTKRRIGPAVRPGLLPKQWRAGFREGSIPPEPPKWSRPGTPALVGPSLRVEGSTYVQRTVTRLGADTTFAFGSYVLTGTGKDALRAFADEIVVDTNANDLIDIDPPTVTIEGHTDSVPYTSHPGGNQWLSEQRANAVRDFLAPIVPEGTTLVAVGYGATRPVASNATSAGRQANRRVDLTYPKTVSARGHRQYLQDSLVYTNPSAHIKRNLTFVSWWSLESYKEPNADGSVIWLGRRPVGSTDDDAWTEADWVDIDAETPLNTWTRSEVSITVPADGQAWEIVARLTPPAGTIVYDEGATELWADDALEFIDVDQALIVKGLVEHAQDPAFDKDDLGIATDTPLTGVKRTRVYYWHERATISDCLEELVNVSGGMDLTWQTTPTTRTLVSHYPRAGQVTTASLQAGEGRTVDDYQISLNGAAAATTVIVQADGAGADREEGVTQGVPDDLDLVLEDVWTAEPGTHIGELNAQAQRGHRHHGGHVPIVTATLRSELTDEWLDRVHLGDVITVDLPARVRHVTGPHRVTARSLDPITDRVIVSPTVEV